MAITHGIRTPRSSAGDLGAALALAAALSAAGCATLPAVLDIPKTESTALASPETTALGSQFGAQARAHKGLSGFRVLPDGVEGFTLRLRIAQQAQRTLDVQYFLLQQDDTGQLLLEAMLAAADRGVRVRILLDDAEAFDAGSKIRPLAAHPNIDIRIYNPFLMRRQLEFMRWAEYLVGSRRLNYRMHNKLFVGDNAIAVTGGRNIGDSYFQASTTIEFGDFDLAVAGPMVRQLSQSFDRYWNDRLAVPAEAMPLGKPSDLDLEACRQALAEHKRQMAHSDYLRELPRGDPLADLQSGKAPLVWATAVLADDSPDKAQVIDGASPGRLMWQRVAAAAEGARRELIIVSPYLVPAPAEMALIGHLRGQGVRVRILTNSLASTDMPIVHAGYVRYRGPLLAGGSELYEVRPLLGQLHTSHGVIKSGSSGRFALHAKVLIVDRERVFIGSMNFDQRSMDINTEIGLIIDSPQLAGQIAERFEAIAQPANSYQLMLEPAAGNSRQSIRWIGSEDGKTVRLDSEPGVDLPKRALIESLSLLPLDSLL